MISISNYVQDNITGPSQVKLILQELCDLKGFSREIFNTLLSYSNYCLDIYPSNEKIALQVGCSERQVQRCIANLVEIGALVKIKRMKGMRQLTNLLKINPIFYLAEIRGQLAGLFSSLRSWGMASLMRSRQLFKKNVTLLNMYLYIKDSLSSKRREYSAQDDINFLQQEKELDTMVEKQGDFDHDMVILQGKHKPSLSHNDCISTNNSSVDFFKRSYPVGDTVYCDSNVSINTHVLFPDHEKEASRAEKEKIYRRKLEESKKFVEAYQKQPARFIPSADLLESFRKKMGGK